MRLEIGSRPGCGSRGGDDEKHLVVCSRQGQN
jgi:hypothetical protein